MDTAVYKFTHARFQTKRHTPSSMGLASWPWGPLSASLSSSWGRWSLTGCAGSSPGQGGGPSSLTWSLWRGRALPQLQHSRDTQLRLPPTTCQAPEAGSLQICLRGSLCHPLIPTSFLVPIKLSLREPASYPHNQTSYIFQLSLMMCLGLIFWWRAFPGSLPILLYHFQLTLPLQKLATGFLLPQVYICIPSTLLS